MFLQKFVKGRNSNFKADFLASIVVFLVALPLCMGIAIASGVPVAAGLITGIVGGLVVGAISGCPLQVSGPAAGLTVIVYDFVGRFGFEMLGIAVLIGGVLQLTAGIFKLGQWFRAVSPAVIKGMLAGIGVLIFASQFHVMLDDSPKGSGIQNLAAIPSAIGKSMTWPEYGTLERRRFRKQTMRHVEELYHRQQKLADQVAERVPEQTTPEKTAKQVSQQVTTDAGALRELLPEQEAILSELKTVTAKLNAFERRSKNGKQSERILKAWPISIQTVQTAQRDLQESRVQDAAQSQAAAAAGIHDLSKALNNHGIAVQIGLLTILSIILWKTLAPKRLKLVPAPLVAVVLATILATSMTIPVLYIDVPNNLWTQVRFPTMELLQNAPWAGILQSAVVIAIVASAETLLCATAVDQMHRGARTKYDKELSAQGIGNIICGMFGALPMTGVIVRSTANIQSGGKTRMSAILHGVWLLIFVSVLAFVLRLIPTSALAAILVYTGYKLIDFKSIKTLFEYGWGEVAIYAATVFMIVATDLLTGVITGVVLAAAKLLYTFSHLKVGLEVKPDDSKAVLSLTGSATFIRLPKLATALENVPRNTVLHVDLQNLDYIDHACLDLLMNWAKQHDSTGDRLVIDWDSLHARFRTEMGHNRHQISPFRVAIDGSSSRTPAETVERSNN